MRCYWRGPVCVSINTLMCAPLLLKPDLWTRRRRMFRLNLTLTLRIMPNSYCSSIRSLLKNFVFFLPLPLWAFRRCCTTPRLVTWRVHGVTPLFWTFPTLLSRCWHDFHRREAQTRLVFKDLQKRWVHYFSLGMDCFFHMIFCGIYNSLHNFGPLCNGPNFLWAFFC